ncbi:transposase [Amycolatopsis anabasis]|uniref:transposase n=1 Tax=Amycolatopsis anabasis TaxID=1840409 RepID=UPI001FE2DED2|nr:transposase [Amycolatopsis anabasis]
MTKAGTNDNQHPRDRNGTFEPAIVRKRQRRLDGLNDAIISRYARGMTVCDIQVRRTDIYGVEVTEWGEQATRLELGGAVRGHTPFTHRVCYFAG